MAISNSWRSLDSQSLATDSRYHNYQVLEYLKQHPASTVLSFSPAWIRPHTNVRIVNYMDPEILHLFDSKNILSAEGLRIELKRLGISHIHKDNYFSFPMIYRTSFQQLLSDSRFVEPVVMGSGGNLFHLHSKSDTDIPTPRCITYSDPYLVTPRAAGGLTSLYQGISRIVRNSPNVVTSRYFNSNTDVTTRFSRSQFGALFNDSAPETSNPSENSFLRIETEIRGIGLASGAIQFSSIKSSQHETRPLSDWVVFSESRDRNGVIRLSGLVPTADEIFRLRISLKSSRMPSLVEISSTTICLQG